MSFLDELKKGSQTAKAKTAEASAPTSKDAAAWKVLRPRMLEALVYFNELVEHLDGDESKVTASYDAPGFGKLRDLKQHKYEVSSDQMPRRLRLECRCEIVDADRLHEVLKKAETSNKRFPWTDNIRFQFRSSPRGDGYKLNGCVPVGFDFEADATETMITLVVNNLNELGTREYRIKPEVLNRELLDELAKALLRQPTRFDELTGNRVSEDMREQFREKIDARKRLREQELAQEKKGLLTRPLGKGFFKKK